MQGIENINKEKIIFCFQQHRYLGWVLNPLVVEVISNQRLSLYGKRLHYNNIHFYFSHLNSNEQEFVKILEQITPEAIVKKFSTKKPIRPKEFFENKKNEALFHDRIRPYIERKMVEVVHQMQEPYVLYIQHLDRPGYIPLPLISNNLNVFYNFKRNNEGTTYFISLKRKDERFYINNNGSLLIGDEKCFIISEVGVLKPSENHEGKRIKPFLNKFNIQIEKRQEKLYFETFIKQLLENNFVYTEGIDIIDRKEVAEAILIARRSIDSIGFELQFQYGNHKFGYAQGKKVNVHFNSSNMSFERLKREKEWEEDKRKLLEDLGFKHVSGSFFKIDDSDSMAIEMLCNCRQVLEQNHITIKVDKEFENIILQKPSIEVFDEKYEGVDWFELKIKVRFGEYLVPYHKLRQNIINRDPYLKLPDGKTGIIPEEWFTQLSDLVKISQDKNSIKVQKSQFKYFVGKEQFFGLKNKVHNKLIPFKSIKPSSYFKGVLRPYQEEGLSWMYYLYNNGFGGCLADDMGLGKTIQTIALLASLNGTENQQQQTINLFETKATSYTHLLVVPSSLVFNWIEEFKKFAPIFRIINHTGPNRHKNNQYFKQYDLVITTYGTVRNDEELFIDFNFDYLILDESQIIKNPNSFTNKVLRKLKSTHRLTLTGTPVENSLVDLWSQMSFLNPNLLGSKSSFKQEYISISKEEEDKKLTKLKEIVSPFILRRTKNQVAKDLPEKQEMIIYCQMAESQNAEYEKRKSAYKNYLLKIDKKSEKEPGFKMHVLKGLMELRQFANHPSLLKDSEAKDSGKTQEVLRLINEIVSGGHKVLIFSSFVKYLKLLHHKIQIQFPQQKMAYLDGSTTALERQKQVNLFQNQNHIQIFLLSLKAGGVGLNLTAADYVFILDPWWNPKAEKQAIDRAHRIGRKNKVIAYKFITKDSIEEKILKLQQTKEQISSKVIENEEHLLKKINLDALKKLLE